MHDLNAEIELYDATTGGTNAEGVRVSEAQPANVEPPKWYDATIMSPFNPDDYDKEVVITFGARRDAKKWNPKDVAFADFLRGLCEHKEGSKDGLAYVLGEMVAGQRLKTAVVALHGVGLDIDVGTPSAVVDAALEKLGCLAVRYTTHSHGKTRTEIKKDKIVKFAQGREIDEALIYNFLCDVEQWDRSIADGAEFVGTEHTASGVVCVVQHPPMPKHRVVLLFAEPFVIGDEAPTQAEAMRKWAKVPEALAGLLGVPFDRSCTDPSRLFYFPRHAKGKPFEISLFGGPYFNWRTLELENPLDRMVADLGKGKSKSVSDEGRALGRWSLKRAHGFQIADVIQDNAPDRIRHDTGHGLEIECPFDEDHSNAGDPEDRACLVVNASEGQSNFFTISCRHETCRNKTNLDMLGKMLKDGWFEKDALESENYNAILEEGEKPEAQIRIEREDDARADYQKAIDALTPVSTDDQVENTVSLCLDAGLGVRAMGLAVDGIAKHSGTKVGDIRKIAKQIAAGGRSKADKKKEDHGLDIFSYHGAFNFDDAVAKCVGILRDTNDKANLPLFTQFDGTPVRLVMRKGRAEFEDMSRDALWSELNKRIAFVSISDQAQSPRQMVPKEVATQVWEQAYQNMPPAPEVVYAPTYLKNGALLLTEGYHFAPDDKSAPRNHLLLLNDLRVPEVPSSPTKEQAQESLNWLRENLLCDFPFCDTDADGKDRREPSEANALALLITPFMRRMIEGRTPLFAITKPQTGSGATYLATLAIKLSQGVQDGISIINYTKSEEEMEKKTVSAIQEARSYLFFDDVKEFNNRVLLRAITSPLVGGRVLGKSWNLHKENTFLWIVTGNNPKIGGEMHRRACWIRLNLKMPVGTKRKYRHADFDAFVAEKRGLAVRHILTMIEYWHASGAEEFTARGLSGFDNWARKVGGVLHVCGVSGFLNTPAPVILDTESASEDAFLCAMQKKYGGDYRGVSDLFEWAEGAGLGIVTGKAPDERQRNFTEALRSLDGRTFAVKKGEAKVLYALRAKHGDDGVEFGIEAVENGAA